MRLLIPKIASFHLKTVFETRRWTEGSRFENFHKMPRERQRDGTLLQQAHYCDSALRDGICSSSKYIFNVKINICIF